MTLRTAERTRIDPEVCTRRRDLCSEHVTLDGRDAIICGALERFATVSTLDGTRRVEFSWGAVESIVAHGGGFVS